MDQGSSLSTEGLWDEFDNASKLTVTEYLQI